MPRITSLAPKYQLTPARREVQPSCLQIYSRPVAGAKGMLTGTSFGAFAEGDQEDGALARGVRREEADYLVIVKGEPGGAKVQSISSKVELAADYAGFDLHRAVSAVAEALQDRLQIGQQKDGDAGVRREVLLQAKISCLGTEIAFFQQLQRTPLAVEEVGSRTETFDGMDDQVQLVEPRAKGIQKIRGHAANGAVEQRGKLSKSDGLAGKLTGGAASEDDALDRIVRDFCWLRRLKRSDLSGRTLYHRDWGFPAPGRDLFWREERRCGMEFAHGGVVDFFPGQRHGLKSERRNLRGRRRRWFCNVPDSHEGKCDLALRIQIEQAIYLGIHEAANDLGGQIERCAHGQQVSE